MSADTTLKDIAHVTGFSVNTVSRALNNKSGVNDSTRRQIQECAAELGYFPNMMAKGIRCGSSSLIGALVSSVSDNFFISLLSGIEEEAHAMNMSILIQNAEEDAARQLSGLRSLLSYGCKNIIVTPVCAHQKVLKLLDSSGVNYVIADRVFSSMKHVRRVSINNQRDSERIVEYLIGHGHRKIAILNQVSRIETETARTLGYREALSRNNIPLKSDYELICANEAEIKAAVTALMRSDDPPTALFVAKDTLSLHAYTALMEAGVRVCEDLSLFIYGDPDWTQAVQPTIHGMARPVREVGRRAVRMLLDPSASSENHREVVLDSEFILRSSVRRL